MQVAASTSGRDQREAVAFIAELIRLQRQVWEMNRQLDRIEADMRSCINELGSEKFEEYR